MELVVRYMLMGMWGIGAAVLVVIPLALLGEMVSPHIPDRIKALLLCSKVTSREYFKPRPGPYSGHGGVPWEDIAFLVVETYTKYRFFSDSRLKIYRRSSSAPVVLNEVIMSPMYFQRISEQEAAALAL